MLEKIKSRHIFDQVGPFCGISVFSFFKHSQMIYSGYVNVATGKSQTGRVKLNISASAGEVKFSLGEGKNRLGLVSITEKCLVFLFSCLHLNL